MAAAAFGLAYDAETEAQLDRWVAAKRLRDFGLADTIRSELRAQGIDPDTARPSDKHGGAQQYGEISQGMAGPGGTRFGADIEAKLDEWVSAKRDRDFGLADSIRSELRAQGIDPDTVRPSDKDFGQQQWQTPMSAQRFPVLGQRPDWDTEAKLDKWVEYKRKKDFAAADAIRDQLRAQGIDPDTVRPSDKDWGAQPAWQSPMSMPTSGRGMGAMMAGPGSRFDADTEAKLDSWVEAKRKKQFETADAIRSELRAQGIDPDSVRPSDKDWGAQPAWQNPAPAMNNLFGAVASAMSYGMGAQAARYDAETEAILDQWVAAKRDRDFATADAIRSDLRAQGIDPDTARPSDKDQHAMVQHTAWPQSASQFGPQNGMTRYDAETEAKLDEWVAAKRQKDFATADSIRSELRANGIDPDTVRPANQEESNWPGPSFQAAPFMQQPMRQHVPVQQLNNMRYDSETEAQLDNWVAAKRCKDFVAADAIRENLRAKGIDPDSVRPPGAGDAPSGFIYPGFGAAATHQSAMMAPMMSSPMMTPKMEAGPKFDYETEAQLDQWVAAKRDKDFATADAIRSELRARGIEPDKERPADKNAASQQGSWAPQTMAAAGGWGSSSARTSQGLSWEVNRQLDRWVEAKRAKDFGTADSIRQALRDQGIDPDTERPSDKNEGSAKRYRRW